MLSHFAHLSRLSGEIPAAHREAKPIHEDRQPWQAVVHTHPE